LCFFFGNLYYGQKLELKCKIEMKDIDSNYFNFFHLLFCFLNIFILHGDPKWNKWELWDGTVIQHNRYFLFFYFSIFCFRMLSKLWQLTYEHGVPLIRYRLFTKKTRHSVSSEYPVFYHFENWFGSENYLSEISGHTFLKFIIWIIM